MINIRPIAVWYQWIWTRVANGWMLWTGEWMRCGCHGEHGTIDQMLCNRNEHCCAPRKWGQTRGGWIRWKWARGRGRIMWRWCEIQQVFRETIEIYVAFLRLGLHQWSGSGWRGRRPWHIPPDAWISFYGGCQMALANEFSHKWREFECSFCSRRFWQVVPTAIQCVLVGDDANPAGNHLVHRKYLGRDVLIAFEVIINNSHITPAINLRAVLVNGEPHNLPASDKGIYVLRSRLNVPLRCWPCQPFLPCNLINIHLMKALFRNNFC